jgi:hypothetical protein
LTDKENEVSAETVEKIQTLIDGALDTGTINSNVDTLEDVMKSDVYQTIFVKF